MIPATTKTPPPLVIGLSPEDAAASLGISKRLLQEMARRGEIPCARRKQTQVFDPEDLRAWMLANKSKVTT